jgi:16S rRNA (guanine(966)-N(2))-methyltransferase RsmD
MRVIAGIFRSRQLKGKPPEGTRPTSDKLRETLFNVLGPAVQDAVFLDGFAGIGGIGIEALSRGARAVYFVDRSRKAWEIIRENLQSLQVTAGVRVLEASMAKSLDLFERDGVVFDIVFLDPPYEREALYTECLSEFSKRPLLAENGLLIMEHSKRVELPEVAGKLRRYRQLTQGDSTLSFYRTEHD